MKKVFLIAIGLVLVGCADKKQLTPAEQWHGYCVSVGNAARSITLDRQNGIEQKQAKEHADKIEDETLVLLDDEPLCPVCKLPADIMNRDLCFDPDCGLKNNAN